MPRLAAIAVCSIDTQARALAEKMADARAIWGNRIQAAEMISETSAITIGVIGTRSMSDAIIEEQDAASG